MTISTYCSAYSTKLGLGFGSETIGILKNSQNKNLFTRANLTNEFVELKPSKSVRLNLGLELAAKTGFSGALNVSDEAQESIPGPTPTVFSGPRIEVLATIRTSSIESKIFAFFEFGFDIGTVKFDRYDFDGITDMNHIGYAGIGFDLNKKSTVTISAQVSRAKSVIEFPEPSHYYIQAPYTEVGTKISFDYKF